MPTYEYKCTRCNYQFEIKQSINDPAPDECPKCGGRICQIFHPAAILYRGSGFFSTDHKPNTRVRSASGQLARRVSETDSEVIMADSPQHTNSKGYPKTTPRKRH